MSQLSKLPVRSRTERWLFIEAVCWLGVMRASIRCFPFRRIIRWFQLAQGAGTLVPNADDHDRAARIGRAIRPGAARTPWQNTCLAQSLAGMAMLRRRGIAGTLFLGVARSADVGQAFAAHAWLCCGDNVLVGTGDESQFTPVACFTWNRSTSDVAHGR